jgi:broad specificity phosphatase PhoE
MYNSSNLPRIFYLRHSSSGLSSEFHSGLNSYGRLQSRYCVRWTLEDIQPTLVYTSPYPRVIQTLQPYCQVAPDTPVIAALALYEFHRNSGLVRKEMNHAITIVSEVLQLTNDAALVRPESEMALRRRVCEFRQFLDTLDPTFTVLVASHQSTCNALVGRALDAEWPVGAVFTEIQDPNGGSPTLVRVRSSACERGRYSKD